MHNRIAPYLAEMERRKNLARRDTCPLWLVVALCAAWLAIGFMAALARQ